MKRRLLSCLLIAAVLLQPIAALAAAPAEWTLGGYLPTSTTQKVYFKIRGRQIVEKLAAKPATGTVLDTDSIIFPGMVDMHNHMEDGFLGLWSAARGQYLNRFEWRSKKEYELAVKHNEAAFDGDKHAVCAALRWAELKALVGGATAIQGSGARGACVSGFGIGNVEIAREFGNPQEIRSNLELVNAGNVSRVFLPMIKPHMDRGASYETALARMMTESGVKAWLDEFKRGQRTLGNGLKLATGSAQGAGATVDLAAARREFTRLEPGITAAVREMKSPDGKPLYKSAAAVNSYMNALKVFLFGDAKSKAYVGVKETDAAKEEKAAWDFLGRGGNIRISGSVKRYLTMFEMGLKKGALDALKTGKASAFITHLAEGRRDDVYNREEYRFAKDMGLLVPGMVLIHAVGMRIDPGVTPARATVAQSDYKHAAANKISLVWSPFSNLLLYGDTLDIAEARASGINIAMGSDWSPTGSKNMLDELKIARRYVDQELKRPGLSAREKNALEGLTDQALVEMATSNAAIAMGVSSILGKVEPGYQADLTLISKSALDRTRKTGKTGYSALVHAEHDDVALVVVKGEPLYGDAPLITKFSQAAKDERRAESLPTGSRRFGSSCGFKKAIRFPFTAPLDGQLARGRDFRSVESLEDFLVRTLDANTKPDRTRKATLDALYTCEESARTQYGQRFATFVEAEVPANRKARQETRQKMGLDDGFNPLKSGSDDGADGQR